MAMQIVLRKSANRQLKTVTTQGERLFGTIVAQRLFCAIDHQIELLAANPYMGHIEQLLEARRLTYRSLVIHEHFKLIYYIDEKKGILYIVALWDTRREPSALVRGIHSK
ncbi:type II toxin-antitoxin system RelE/ParE family toxin [Bacteroides cellulosilyticus]|uniref:type II toxin-antitoxin system RelE/ParE family toxin n=1 Tax=Bacteroides cellulosilyticus TaxID=246787 RepID=UPI0032C172D1